MADLNIPKLNKKSEKYLFKNKLTLRKKSKKKLLYESLLMISVGTLLLYINLLIPKKTILFKSFFINLEQSIVIFVVLFSYLFKIFLVFFKNPSILRCFHFDKGNVWL